MKIKSTPEEKLLCSICKVPKTLDNTNRKSSSLNGLDTHCKSCKKNLFILRRNARNKEEIDRVLQHQREYNKKYEINNPSTIRKNKRSRERRMFDRTKSRAKMNNIPFNIDLEDIIIPKYCPILEIEMKYNTKTAPSIDRIIPELGYIKGNILIISRKANTMKNDASLNELKTFCKNSILLLCNSSDDLSNQP